MPQVGRISGPLLEANLLRNGINLKFHNDSTSDNLLVLEVNDSKIGIKTPSPTRELEINDSAKSVGVLVDDLVTNDEIEITNNNTITSLFSPLEITAVDYVFAGNIRTDDLNINRNEITTTLANSNIELRPNSGGTLEVYNDFNVTGSIYATGDITFDGDIIFGDQNTDGVSFSADVTSDILPDVSGTYDLGSPSKTWNGLHTYFVNGDKLIAGGLGTDGLNFVLRQGNIWYVAINGLDTNEGDHPNGPYRTVAQALSQAQDGDTIYIYPGTYEEALPLTVPVGVSVVGTDLRSVIIKPDTSSQSEDVFLMNGETTVSNLTIKDFYYDSVNDTGYAFRFAPGFKVTTRSPYVQNITVITQGTTTSLTDPRGFDSGDAGKGALVDGSVADSSTKEASMLFHSVTFITPGVDALTMTNGVRVEWLNSFTYFANKSLYATQGLGRVSQDGSTLRYGAEIRSIGSACVYGNYGAWADGEDTLMYLIQHNFAYIGTGKSAENDTSLVVQENETVELNDGHIYYQSMDQEGDFRVGDTFIADFQSGRISINGFGIGAEGITAINFGGEGVETNIDATRVETGNIEFSGNTISSISGAINILASSGETNLTQDVAVEKNLAVTGDTVIAGTITLGNQTVDVVEFGAEIDLDIKPSIDGIRSLGKTDKRWADVQVASNIFIDDNIQIDSTVIETTTSNSDLELRATAPDRIYLPTNDLEIDNDLTVNSSTDIDSVSVTGQLTQVGSTDQTGNKEQLGNVDITGDVRIYGTAQFSNININDNVLQTTLSNSDLELVAANTGRIYVPANDVEIDQDLTVAGNITAGSYSITTTVSADKFTTGDIEIDDNFIRTTVLNNDLELLASGVGRVYVSDDNVELDQQLTVNSLTTLVDTNITGLITQVSDTVQTGNRVQAGSTEITENLSVSRYAQFYDYNISYNVISTTEINSDINLQAAGTGRIYVPSNDVTIDQNLTVGNNITAGSVDVDQTVTSERFTTGDILIQDNYITTTVPDSDLTVTAYSGKKINIGFNPVEIDQQLTVNSLTTLVNTAVNGTVTQIGNTTQTGSRTQLGNFSLTGDLSVSTNAYLEEIDIIGNKIQNTTLDSDLTIKASGAGRIYLPSSDLEINQNFTVQGTIYAQDIVNSGTVTTDIFTTGDIEIRDNYIRTTQGNSNLELSANNAGGVLIERLKFTSSVISANTLNDSIIFTPGTGKNVIVNDEKAVVLPKGTTAQRTLTQAELRFNTSDNLFDGFTTARRTLGGGVFSANRLTNVKAHPTNNTLNFTVNSSNQMTVNSTGIIANGLLVDGLLLNSNVFSTTGTDDITLTPNGTGFLDINNIYVDAGTISNQTNGALTLTTTGTGSYVVFGGTAAIQIPAGLETEIPATPQIGDTRWNIDNDRLEVYDGTQYNSAIGTDEGASLESTLDVSNVWSLILG